jgi:Zn-dependent protease
MTSIFPDSPLIALIEFLAFTNFWLGMFNLIPAFPLDGGRITRAVLWALTGNPTQATQWAVTMAQLIAGLFAIYGILRLAIALSIASHPWIECISSLWIIIVGWFLAEAAQNNTDGTIHYTPMLDETKQED